MSFLRSVLDRAPSGITFQQTAGPSFWAVWHTVHPLLSAVMLRSVPTWSRMCCGTPRSLGRRSAAFSNTRFADSSVSPKMFDRVYGHHHPDHLAGAANALTGTGNGGRIAGGNAATNVNKRERTRQKTLKIQENPGSEPRSGRGGRRFKSCHSDQHLAEFSSRFATGCAPG